MVWAGLSHNDIITDPESRGIVEFITMVEPYCPQLDITCDFKPNVHAFLNSAPFHLNLNDYTFAFWISVQMVFWK